MSEKVEIIAANAEDVSAPRAMNLWTVWLWSVGAQAWLLDLDTNATSQLGALRQAERRLAEGTHVRVVHILEPRPTS